MNGSWLGHSLHAVIVDVVVGGATAALLLDVLRVFFHVEGMETATTWTLGLAWISGVGAIVTGLIFDRYPSLAEGEMARLRSSVVNTIALADLARSLGVGAHIRLGKGEEASGGRDKPSLLADTFEALVGAVWLDRGMEEVRRALEPVFERRLSAHLAAGERYDVKTALQEVAVRERKAMPHYRVSSSGPDHDKRFRADVLVDDEILGAGVGRSKKEAELNAAREAIRILGSGEAQHRGGAQNGSEATDACAS